MFNPLRLEIVKYYALLAGSLAFGQSVTTIAGNGVPPSSVVTTDGERTQLTRSINGRQVPVEQSVERVLREDASGKTVERIVRNFDPNGQPVSTDRIVVETEVRGNGSTERTTVYRSDINGRMQAAERKTVESATQGAVTDRQVVVERSTINGGFQAVEKRVSVSTKTPSGTHEDETVNARSENGGFYAVRREVKDTAIENGQTTVKATVYQPRESSALALTEQSVATTTRRDDGSEVSQINVYRMGAGNGRAYEYDARPTLSSQTTVERRRGADGSVVETESVRLASISDAGRLGPVEKVSETVCTGKCR
jgi:hypothetical protein